MRKCRPASGGAPFAGASSTCRGAFLTASKWRRKSVWHPDSNVVSLMCGCPDPTTPTTVVCDGRRVEATPSRSALHEGHVVLDCTRCHKPASSRTLSLGLTERLQDTHVRTWPDSDAARAVGCQAERLVRRKQPRSTRTSSQEGSAMLERRRTGAARPDLPVARFAYERGSTTSRRLKPRSGQSESNSTGVDPIVAKRSANRAIPGCRGVPVDEQS